MKVDTLLNGKYSRLIRLCAAAAGFVALSGLSQAQESLVGFGRVDDGGFLESGYSAVGGTLSSTRIGVGHYEIDFVNPGAFAGTSGSNYHIGLTVNDNSPDDELIMGDIWVVNDDNLRVEVYLADVEDDTDTMEAEARDLSFFFHVFRISGNGSTLSTTSSILATGTVASNGEIGGAVSAHGTSVTSVEVAPGEYAVTVAGPGLFAGDSEFDYSLGLTCEGPSFDDDLVRGNISSVASNDAVTIQVFTDDAQNESNDNLSNPTARGFHFVVFRAPTGSIPSPPPSSLLAAVAHVNGSGGTLYEGATGFAGGTIGVQQLGTGDYQLIISAPGAFAGRSGEDYSLQLQCIVSGHSDSAPIGRITIVDASTMQVDVGIADVEEPGTNAGTPTDEDFTILILASYAEVQGDLSLGKKLSDSAVFGNDVYSSVPASQKLKLRAKKSGKAKFFFQTGNDGNLSRDVAVSSRGKIKGVKPRIFLLSGARQNVTAAIKRNAHVLPNLAPEEKAIFKVTTKPKKNSKKKKTKIQLQAVDVASGAAQDAVQARITMP